MAPMVSENQYRQAAAAIDGAQHVVALTGAGISVESGIPPFRGPGGVWETIDPMEYAHIDAFMRDPAKVWRVLIAEMKTTLDRAAPNAAHKGLFRLEQMGRLRTVITQNIDGLHQQAGNTDVIEFHGNFAWQSCLKCRQRVPTGQVDLNEIPPHCACGGVYRPECIFFGEMIPPQHLRRSQSISAACDVMLVIGTSATVQPAAYMPVIAKQTGAKVIEVNMEPTPLTRQISDVALLGPAGETMQRLVAELEAMM